MTAPRPSPITPLAAAASAQLVACFALYGLCCWLWPAGRAGALWGGLLMAANLQLIVLISGLAKGEASHWLPAVCLFVKSLGMLLGTTLIVRFIDPDPLALVAGFATLLVGLLGAALAGAWRQKGRSVPWTIIPPG